MLLSNLRFASLIARTLLCCCCVSYQCILPRRVLLLVESLLRDFFEAMVSLLAENRLMLTVGAFDVLWLDL